jgi:D-alanine-D-alanine ligase
MKKLIVLRGGPSSEYEISLKTGKSIIDELSNDYHVTDVIIDKNGDWYHQGIQQDPARITRHTDCVINAMHGEYGEDGTVQRLLEKLAVPYTGPRVLGAAISMNKVQTKDIYKKHGIKTPLHAVVERQSDQSIDDITIDLFRKFPMPVILKPVGLGSSVGISIARDFESLKDTLTSLFIRYDKILVEEYIVGKEATVGVLEGFRDNKIYPFLPIEIVPPAGSDFFDADVKYDGSTTEISPGNFTKEEKELMQEWAILAHDILNLRHYSRTDFIIHPRRGIYVLETNSLPGLTAESLLPKSFESVGSNYKEFLDHIIDLAIQGK